MAPPADYNPSSLTRTTHTLGSWVGKEQSKAPRQTLWKWDPSQVQTMVLDLDTY